MQATAESWLYARRTEVGMRGWDVIRQKKEGFCLFGGMRRPLRTPSIHPEA